MTRLILFAPLLFLAACATLSESECRAGDWYAIGKKDGANGRQSSFLQQHAKACADYGIRPDQTAWEEGRRDGLPLYCTRRRAFEEGRRGKHLSPVCPSSQLAELTRANERGLRVNRIEQDIREIENDIRQINSELASLPADDPSRSSLISERSFLRLDLLTLRAERARMI
ncbi:MAG: DUF2799 domain-containing protein [Paracoccaceae bacterium]|nr:DUF2799 domain-containing protein [Paracoccaceae bacterium]